MRKLLIGVFGLIALIVGAALVVPQLLDWNDYKAEIAAEVKKATGRELRIGGDLDFAVLPSPRLSAHDVRLANLAGASAPDMVRLKALRVRIAFWPLLDRRVEVESIELVEPVIELEALADGRRNWDLAPPTGKPAGAAPPASAAPAAGGNGGDALADESFRLDRLRITDGRLVYRDAAAGTVQEIKDLDVELSADSLAGPFIARGGFSALGVAMAVEARIGRLGGAPAPVAVHVEVAGSEVDFSGRLDEARKSPRLQGRLRAKGADLGRLVAALAGGGGGDAAPAKFLSQPFSLDAKLDGSDTRIAVDGVEFQFGGATATGRFEAVLGKRIRAKAAIKVNRINLDKWLAMEGPPAPAPAGSPRGGPTVGAAPSAAGGDTTGSGGFTLPGDLQGGFDLMIGAVTLRGGLIRNVRLSAALDAGELTLNQASLRLPGGAEAALFGFLATPKGQPKFEGNVDLRADNLRALLQWLKIDVASVPADRLRKFSLSGKLRGDDRLMQLTRIKMKLDATQIDGGITYALRRRPAFGARLNVDRLNVDAYLPPPDRKARAPAAAPATGRQTATPAGTDAAPLSVLNDFDANLKLNIRRMSYRRTQVKGIAFDGTLLRGALTLKRASVRNLGGATVSIKGKLSDFTAVPRFSGSFAASAKDLTGLLRLADLETSLSAARLGRFRLSGQADAAPDRVHLKSNLEIAGMKLSLTGNITGTPEKPRVDLTVAATHPDGARLARAFGAELRSRRGKAEKFSLSTTAKGGLQSLTVKTDVEALGGRFGYSGTIRDPLAAVDVDLAINASHPEFARLMQAFAEDAAPVKPIGPLKFATRVSGGGAAVTLSGLRASLGPMTVNGEGRMTFGGARPSLAAKLTAGVIDLNALMPPDKAGGKSAAGKGAKGSRPAATPRYSRDTLDLSALDALDADIGITAKALLWDTFRVDKPRIAVILKDRVLTIRHIAGKMFGGAFDMTGRLSGRKIPAIEGTVKIDKANVGQALFQAADFDIAKGILSLDMELAGTGMSEFAMVSSLNGKGRMAVRNGSVKGFDLQAVSNRLKRLKRATDYLSLFGAAMGGGKTDFSRLDGTFRITKGVVRTDDLTLIAAAGRGDAKGYVDLPRWNMDVTSEFRLTEHPKAPPFAMRVQGPPDKPRRKFQFKKMQAYLLQRNIGKFLKKVVPRQPQPSAAKPAQKTPEKLKPEDILKGLLKGLRR